MNDRLAPLLQYSPQARTVGVGRGLITALAACAALALLVLVVPVPPAIAHAFGAHRGWTLLCHLV